jgi:hypothetical protein
LALDTITGEVETRTLLHEGNEVREFYSQLPRPVLVGIEVIGPMLASALPSAKRCGSWA